MWSKVGWFGGLAAIFAAAYVVDSTRYTPESTASTAAGSVFAAALSPWLAWLFVRWKRRPARPPSFAAYFFVGTPFCLALIYYTSFTR